MTDLIIALCTGLAATLACMAIGWHFGVKTAFATMKSIARQHLNDADYAAFVRLLNKITEAQ